MDLQPQIIRCRRRWQQAPHSRVFAPLAELLVRAGRRDEALAVLNDGLARHPDFTGGLIVLGRTLLGTDRSDEARRILRRVLELDAANVVALRLLAEDARSRDAWPEAIPHLERLVDLEGDDPRWAGALAEARRLADTQEAGDRIEPADDDRPSFATLTLVDIYLAQGYRAKAVATLRQMLKDDPERSDARLRLEELLSDAAESADAAHVADPFRAMAAGSDGPPEDAGEAEANVRQRQRRRERDKKQFSAWIDRVRDNRSDGP